MTTQDTTAYTDADSTSKTLCIHDDNLDYGYTRNVILSFFCIPTTFSESRPSSLRFYLAKRYLCLPGFLM